MKHVTNDFVDKIRRSAVKINNPSSASQSNHKRRLFTLKLLFLSRVDINQRNVKKLGRTDGCVILISYSKYLWNYEDDNFLTWEPNKVENVDYSFFTVLLTVRDESYQINLRQYCTHLKTSSLPWEIHPSDPSF